MEPSTFNALRSGPQPDISKISKASESGRWYWESDGDENARTYYVCNTHALVRYDFDTKLEARKAALALNLRDYPLPDKIESHAETPAEHPDRAH